jgi:hypothetical protein
MPESREEVRKKFEEREFFPFCGIFLIVFKFQNKINLTGDEVGGSET